MENVDNLLNKKMMMLEKILQMTKRLILTENNEENYDALIKLMNEREVLFNDIKKIDSKILSVDKNASLVNNTILDIRDKIVELDKKIQPELQKVKIFYMGRVKGLKEGRKITNHFNSNAFTNGNFDIQG